MEAAAAGTALSGVMVLDNPKSALGVHADLLGKSPRQEADGRGGGREGLLAAVHVLPGPGAGSGDGMEDEQLGDDDALAVPNELALAHRFPAFRLPPSGERAGWRGNDHNGAVCGAVKAICHASTAMLHAAAICTVVMCA